MNNIHTVLKFVLSALRRGVTVGCQWLVGGTFLVSGLAKAIDPTGTALKLSEYLQYFGFAQFTDLTMAMAWLMALAEFALGLFVFFGHHRKMFVLAALAVLLVFTPLTLWLALTNAIDDCGCFGDAVRLTNWQTLGKNVVLLFATIWLSFCRKWMISPLVRGGYAFYFYYAMVIVVGLCALGSWRMPYIDFRPYRPGVDLRAMALGHREPAAEGADVEYRIVYAKDGVLQEFALDSIPDDDSGWEFVETREVRTAGAGADNRQAAQSALQLGVKESGNLMLLDDQTLDRTDEVLGDTGYVFLLLSPSLTMAIEHDLDRIESLYEYAMQHGYAFWCITEADARAVDDWRFRTGAEYPVLYADRQEIETMMRPNPGVMLLHDGVIMWKAHPSTIDIPGLTSATLSEQTYGQIVPIDRKRRVFALFVCFFAPLLLYLPLQIVYKLLHKDSTKMRKKIVAGNWKMNTTLQEGVALAEGLKAALAGKKVNCDVVVCTPFISVASVVNAVAGSIIGVGAEDCSEHDKGAYTGEVAANMVASTGAKYVILGHSERRQYHGENNAILVNKLNQALQNGLTPIFCVGEKKEERENGTFKAVIESQMEALYTLSAEDFAKVIVAYEPVWAIGTGLTATSQQAEEVHAAIRASIAKKYNQQIAEETSILYGGSCKASNAPELFAQPDIDGGLIGGAALKVETFMPIIEAWG